MAEMGLIIVLVIAGIAIWYWRDPEFFERLGRDGEAQVEQPPDGAIDDDIGWSEGEWD